MGRIALIGVALALAASGCGSSVESPPPQVSDASLRIRHVVDPSEGLYTEGSIWHVRVLDSQHAVVMDRKLDTDRVSLVLEPGRYRVESEELPCDGTCSHLDPPMDRCWADLVAATNGTIAAKVMLRPGRGCKIDLAK
jgi:hypothetical protein